MSDASHSFLSLLRRGLAAITPATATGPRVGLPIAFTVGGGAVPGLPELALRGPGDVVGFDARAISRTWPARDALNAEPNDLALVELAEPDLPWRYTPAASTGDRLTPWLCLLVVEDDEIAPFDPSVAGRPFAQLVVTDAGALPPLAQAWAWAHAQIVGLPTAPATDFDGPAVNALVAGDPARVLARLLSPRRLDPQTRYLACLVPTFERGRRAGLGLPVDGVDRRAPAWQPGAAPVTLPVYASWRFQTGAPGDFASLVAELKATAELPADVWQRELSLSTPGADPPTYQTVGLAGALVALGATVPPWSSLDTHGFTAALATRLNAAGTRLEPTLYGRWLAAQAQLSTAANATPPWFHGLNADPRARAAAGLGTAVVNGEQDALLAGAWAQVDGIRRINEKLRLGQLARELASRVFKRHFSVGGDGFLQLTAPLHAQIRAGSATVQHALAQSPIAPGAVGAAWRRAARPLGSLGARQGRPGSPTPPAAQGALARMNAGTLSIVPPPAAPPATTSSGAAAQRLGTLGTVFAQAKVSPIEFHKLPLPGGVVVSAPVVMRLAPVPPGGPPGPHGPPPPPPPPPHPPPPGPLPATQLFAQTATTLLAQLGRIPAAGVTWTRASLDTVQATLVAGLDPRKTIEAPLAARLGGVTAGPKRVDPIEPVMAAPDFPQPMYEPLARLSPSWLIAGLDKMPPNTVALLTTNWAFVESYLVGLNHELGRKLLWNGYPTDQRGTYFRHFWDIRSRVDGTTGGDVGPIHAWTQPLGNNRALPTDPLVLLVRGELIRRYPNVVVYAAGAVGTPGNRFPGPTEKHPIFFARLDPDVALYAFDLDPAVARGNPGWFFVLQEHPSEPRFGLAAAGTAWGQKPGTWQALGWDHLAASAAALEALRFIDLDAALPQHPVTADPIGAVWHGGRSGDLAYITLRRPKRYCVHGSVLVPSGASP